VRGYRTSPGDVDIVARRGATLALIEVKARIERAAAGLLQERPELAWLSMRFDAMLVAPGRLPVHLTGAWRPEA
jgi:putative endonuclease